MGPRHRILYDLERWRRYRMLFLLPAAALVVVTGLNSRQRSSAPLSGYLAAFLLSLLLSSWLRQRFSYLRVESGELVVHTLVARARVPLASVRRSRVMRLGGAYERPERRRYMPRPPRRWADKEALSLRLGGDVDLVRLRRLLGARCVMDDELVVPLVDSRALLAELGGATRSRAAAVAPAPGRRRRKPRR